MICRMAALLAAAALLSPGGALAYEQPAYDVHRSADGYEIRRYAATVVVETEVAGGFDDARNAAFRRLFAYISGDNAPQQKVDMTVPVLSRQTGTQIDMTAPVVTRSAGGGERQLMQFVLPSRFTADTAPKPLSDDVRIRQLPERWVAARTYSGRSSESGYRENEAELLRRLEADGIKATGTPSFAVYNSPFTPWFMRRNEVIVPIAPPQ